MAWRLWARCIGRCSITSSLLVLLLVLLDWDQLSPKLVQSQTQNEPLNFNFIISLPWDVANTLRAPIAGPVSLVLSVTIAIALTCGIVLAPVNYLLGYPPRIYHSYRKPGLLGRSLDSDATNYTESFSSFSRESANHHSHARSSSSESFDVADVLVHIFHEVSSARFVFDRDESFAFGESQVTGRELVVHEELEKAPGFLDSIFLLVPEEDEICRQLLVCHAHGFLPFLPTPVVKVYKLLRYKKIYITIIIICNKATLSYNITPLNYTLFGSMMRASLIIYS